MLECWNQQEMTPQILLYLSLADELCAVCGKVIFRPVWKLLTAHCTWYEVCWGGGSEKGLKSKIIRATHSLWNPQKYITKNLPPSYSCTCGKHNPSKQETNNEQTLTCHKLILSIKFHQPWRCRNWLDWIPLQVIEFCSSRLFSFHSFISGACAGSFFPFTVVLIFNPWYNNGDRYILVEWNL